ncbi:MAG: glycine betaine ABC transporter substrate-binding protein [Bryobacteraceae bacterium]
MSRKSTMAVVAGVLLVSGCGDSKKPIVVGSKSTTAQVVLGEIVAQHLEHRLGRKIGRSLSLGNTPLVYQALTNGEIGVYPEETGTVQALILRESRSSDAATTLERVRNEMRRIAQVVVLDPLGVDDSWAVIVRNEKIQTLSDAERAKTGWKLGITRDFNQRADGLSTLNQYRLPMGAPPRVSDPGSLYAEFESGTITMLVGSATDGPLARHSEWKVLRDDKKVFPVYQTCLMVRVDLLLNDLKLQPALAELSGRITNDVLRKLDAEVDVDHRTPAEVAAEFLAQAGLK